MIHIRKIALDTPTKEEADEEVQLLVDLRNSITKKDLVMLLEILKNDPGIVEMVRKYYGK